MSASGQYWSSIITKSDRTSTLPLLPLPPPMRSNFAQTCNLLSQYVKGGGGGGLAAAATGICGLLEEATATKSETATMKLLEVSAPSSADLATTNCTYSKEMEGEREQLTIFYGGKVFVYDDFPADRARELLLLASDAAVVAPTPAYVISPPPPTQQGGHLHANPSELPTARRSSLHRFLEKRKYRAAARGPYHQQLVQNASDLSYSSKNDEQLELKL